MIIYVIDLQFEQHIQPFKMIKVFFYSQIEMMWWRDKFQVR